MTISNVLGKIISNKGEVDSNITLEVGKTFSASIVDDIEIILSTTGFKSGTKNVYCLDFTLNKNKTLSIPSSNNVLWVENAFKAKHGTI